ncbi:MAG: hypothetical protein ACOZJX_05760 [Pseudomonadota bacterium]
MKRFVLPALLLAVLAAAGLLLAATAASAAPVAAAQGPDTTAMSPSQRVQAHRAWNRARRAALPAQTAAIDSTPPQLRLFTIEGDVDAQADLPAAVAKVSMTDDLAGLQTVIVTLVGPSGQMVQRVEGLSTGQRRLDGRLSIGAAPVATVPFSRFTEPGTWTVESVFISDAAYNGLYLGRDQLAAMGRTQFTVHNTAGHDTTGPRLVGGYLETRRVSLSTPPAGTWSGTMPWLSAGLRTVDDGNGAVSGPADAILAFCLINEYNDCVDRFELQGHVNEFGRPNASFRVGGQLRTDQMPGKYFLYYAVLMDQARNMTYLSTSLLGGDTDFSQYFPNTVITVEP